MELHGRLDSAGVAADRRLIFLLLLLFLPNRALPQTTLSTTDRISEVKKLYEARRWSEVVQAVAESPDEAADLELYRGLALAQLQRWGEAKKAFEAGLVRNPRDTRLLVELAGSTTSGRLMRKGAFMTRLPPKEICRFGLSH